MPRRRAVPKGCFWREGTLWGRIKIRGRDIKWSLRTDDPAVARRRRAEGATRAIGEAHYGEAARRTFAEALAAWEPHIATQVGPRTQQRYAVSLGQLAPHLEGAALDAVNAALIAEIIRDRRADGATNATIRRDLVALSSVMNHAIDLGWIDANPVLPRMQRLRERRDPIEMPGPDDIRRVIAAAPGPGLKALVETAWLTGCRLEELAAARRSQVDFARSQLTVIGKGNRLRVIDLDERAMTILRALPAAIGNAPLFFHHGGRRYANLSSRFRAIVSRVEQAALDAGEPFRAFRFHDLRHRAAVDWLKAGRSIYDLQQRLGHRSIKTTEIYLAYLTPAEQRAAKLGKAGERPGEHQATNA
jgi:integrase/recombinase XerD